MTVERRVEVGGVGLALLEAGAGGRPLLLVHGFGGAKEDFADHLPAFAAAGWHAVAPDLRGHGSSDWPDGVASYSFEAFAGDLVGLAGALGWGRFVLLGHSMGGMVAQRLVLDRPDLVAGLVLMDTAHGPMDWFDLDIIEMACAIVRDQGVEGFVRLSNELRDSDPLVTPAFRRLLAEKEGYAEFCDRKALATAADMRLAMMPVFPTQDERLAALASVAVPTLVVAGEQDHGFLQHSERMAAAIPGARLAVIPEAGHSPQFENPPAWWDAVSGFLSELAHRAA